MAALEASQSFLGEKATTWGSEVIELVRNLRAGKIDCQPDVDTTVAQAKTVALPENGRAALSRALPSFASAQTAMTASSLEVRLAGLNQTATILPFVSGEYSQLSFSHQTLGSVVGGVSVSWNIPGERGRLEIEAADLAFHSAKSLVDATYFRNFARLNSLTLDIPANEKTYQALKRSLQNSRELIRTLLAQRAIGSVDSLSYTNAYLNTMDAKFSVLETWSQLERTILEISIYRDWVKANAVGERN